jgi:hypothetical protein
VSEALKNELRNALAPILSAIELRNLRPDESCSCQRELIEHHVRRMIDLLSEPRVPSPSSR